MLIWESITIKLKPSPNNSDILFWELNDRYYTIEKNKHLFSVYKKWDRESFYSIYLWDIEHDIYKSKINMKLHSELFDENWNFSIKKYRDFESNIDEMQLKKIRKNNKLIDYEYEDIKTFKHFTQIWLFIDKASEKIYLVLYWEMLLLTEIVESDLKRLK